MFSCLVGGLFTLLTASFDAQNGLILTNSSLSTFSFVACDFGVVAKANVVKLLPYIFLTSFIFLARIFGPLIHVK